jgi:hypothetical protein
MCNYLALTSPTLLSLSFMPVGLIWERRKFDPFLAPFSPVWERG